MKRKININRPEISADEINQRKNFDSALNQRIQIDTKPLIKKPWFLSSIAVITVAIITTIVLLNNNKPIKQQTTNNKQLSNSNSLALEEFYKNEETKSCINPPLKGINIPYTFYKVESEKGCKLNFKTGSVLTIPKNAFADANGKPLKGEVEIRYREFHDAVDFLVSGIPMTYDSAGVRYHFESAGMMEILAYQNGQQVKMMPDKSINVELASKDESTAHNLYKLDTFKNDWSCIGKDRVVKKSEKPQPQLVVDSTPSFSKPKEILQLETKKTELKKDKENQLTALPKVPAQPKKPEQAKKDKYTFNIEVDAKEFPELAVYKGAMFEVGDENKSFTKAMYEITWDDAKLKNNSTKGDNYILTLKKGFKQYEYVVYPVFEGKNYETALKNFQEKFTVYTTTLEKRTKEEKRIEAEYNAKLAALKKQQEEMERKWKEEEANRFKTLSTELQVSRTFAINSFGVFNCDNPRAYPTGVITFAQLNNEKNVKLVCYDVYLVDKKINGMFTYAKNPINSFSYNPNASNILWTVENGVLYYLKPEDFKNISGSNGIQNIKMKAAPTSFKTAEEIKAFFEI